MTPNIRRNERPETGGARRRSRPVAAALSLSLLLTALVVAALALPVTALAAGEHDSHSNGWTELKADTTTLSGGSYYLSGDVEYSGTESITVSGEVILCLNDHKLDLKGQHISVGSGASLTLCDCSTGGVLTGGSGSKGGGVYVGGGGTFTMTGGSIAGNTAESGGGVYVDEGGTFTMEDGSINNNKANSGGGGGVMVNKGSFTLSGGSITGNATSDATYGYGGGVCLYGTFNLSGDAIIQNNTKAGATDNLYLGWNTINITGPLGENARIGVTAEGVTAEGVPRSFISGWSDNMAGEDPADYFSSDGDAWDIGLNANGDVVLGSLCTIVNQPADKSVIEGETATFTVNATGSEPLSYQWQQRIDNGNNWTNIASANAAEYTTGKTTMAMSGYQYRCVVTANGVSVISAPATLTVNAAATTITTQPGNVTVTEGETATFSVTATGSNLTYQWQQSTDGSAWANISGATGISYTTQATTMDMNGYQYRCVVTGNGGSVTSDAATLTVTAATVPVTGVTLNKTSTSLDVGDTETLTPTITPSDATNKNVTWSSDNTSVATVDADGKVTAAGAGTATITVTTADGNKTATCVVTVTYPYVPPRPTGPDWGDVADDISDAEPGSTVKVDMEGETVLPGEVLDELAGSDVTLALDMGDGVSWEIYGGDVPESEGHDDVDLGVALGGDDIPADVVNLVTGESGSVQVSLEHDGLFGFELTLVAPLGEDAAGLVANLYRYDDEAGSLGYEASAQVDNEGVARLPFDHASSWLVALDSRSHALPFSDAAEGEWYSEAVRWAWLSGLMTGYGDGSGAFGTEGALSRAQLATVLWRQAGEPEAASEASFADCDPGAFYAEAVAWADEAGIIEGYGGGANFGPEDPVTREQLATILWRAAGEPEGKGDLSGYPDGDDATDYAVPALEWAVDTGVLSGFGDGSLAPGGVLSRAQLAAVLMRLAQEVA